MRKLLLFLLPISLPPERNYPKKKRSFERVLFNRFPCPWFPRHRLMGPARPPPAALLLTFPLNCERPVTRVKAASQILIY